MADDEQSQTEGKIQADWTGTKIGVLLLPVFLFFVYLGKAEIGFTIMLVLGLAILAIKLRWKLRRHAWFWATIALVLTLHIPLLFIVHWPNTKIPTIAFSMPLGVADFLLISGALSLAEKWFSNSDEEDA